jgi:hypothetical protein
VAKLFKSVDFTRGNGAGLGVGHLVQQAMLKSSAKSPESQNRKPDPGFGAFSPRSGRGHKAWGGAPRNPRIVYTKKSRGARRAADRVRDYEDIIRNRFTVVPLSAHVQALCHQPLRRAGTGRDAKLRHPIKTSTFHRPRKKLCGIFSTVA